MSLLVEYRALSSIVDSVNAFDRRLSQAKELLEIASDDEVARWLEREIEILRLWMRAMECCR